MNDLTIDLTQDIQSVTTVPPSVRQTSSNNCGRTSAPWSSTVKGKAAAVVQDAGAYQRLLDIAAAVDPRESIRQGLERSRKGEGQPAREFFREFDAEVKKKHGLPR
ncbi:MAG: prevent-host-death protein [Candidatus Acidiferrum sp.]